MTTPAERLILVGICGGVAGLCAGIATDDFRARAVSDEKNACKDLPDKAAYYVRRPGEGHNTERCEKIMRFGSPDWIPYMTHPLKQERR